MSLLLDTSAYSGLMRGHGGVSRLLRGTEGVLFSTVVAGELLAGFRRGTRERRNRLQLDRFLSDPHVTILPVSWRTAERFALIAADLRARGTPIPTNDIWIAAHALETGAELVSFDRHFQHVASLAWILPEDEE